MTKTLDIEEYLTKDDIACKIATFFVEWNNYRQNWLADREEIQRYIFANDTSKTTNSSLPWSNKTTIPKLCQIRDNLFANYMATMFPRRKNYVWEGATPDDESKANAIESYITWATDRPEYYHEVAKLVLDYIDYGNVFVMPEWIDKTPKDVTDKNTVGYIGPTIRRIAPTDIVFNPASPTFTEAPKIVRSIVSIGEVKEMLSRDNDSNMEFNRKLFKYMQDLRHMVANAPGDFIIQDAIYQIAGFNNFREYLGSEYCEILTFYGDIYNEETGEFKRNQIIKVVDRHKIFSQEDNPSFFGSAPIYHVGWRMRPDNLWAMGPLDNLVGMQYRIDHIENMKADIWDLTRYPIFKIKGYVDDFNWEPGEKIYIGDDGDVELVSPDVAALQANTEIAMLEAKMEEMAGSPKEAMGFRTPGEKTKYEVQRLENAASRIFQNKTAQFEINLVEQYLNAMLELAWRKMGETTIRILNDEFKIADFQALTPQDITGVGRVRPMAARHFAEQAQMVQDLNAFFSSPAGQDPEVLQHFSSKKLADFWERMLDIENEHIVMPYVRIAERQEAQQLLQSAQQQTMSQMMTPTGIGADYDESAAQGIPGGQPVDAGPGPGPGQGSPG